MSEHQTDSRQETEFHETVNTPRRRLTGAALAGPVVLGTLASKQALGAVPYNCTVSGQISNNFSPTGHQGGDCSTLGLSPGCWKQNFAVWPVDKRATTFQTVFGYAGFGTATLIQVLCTETYGKTCPDGSTNPMSSGGLAPLARAAVANYLNSKKFGAPNNFPLTTAQIKSMFLAVANGTDPLPTQTGDPSKTTLWYFTSLYGGSVSNVDGGNMTQCPVDQSQVLALNKQCK